MFARIPFRQAKPVPFAANGAFVPALPGVAQSTALADLASIYQPDINLCLIGRPADPEIERFVAGLWEADRRIDLTEKIHFEHYDFSTLALHWVGIPGYPAWRADVMRLTALFCDLFGVERVGLRLRTLEKAMCPRFHTDHVLARLVCTYGGLGTEWLPNDAVDRGKLGARADGLPDEESGVVRKGHAIRQMPAFTIGLMKGDAWEGNEQRGLVHRSPRPDATTPRRLLLTLDLL